MKNIIFDLGGVLITFQPREFLYSIIDDHQKAEDCFQLILKSKEWPELDRGTLTVENAKKSFLQRNPALKPEIELFFAHWQDMFQPIPETVEILQVLHLQGYSLYALSNFIEELFDALSHRFEFFSLFQGMVMSYKIKSIKPEPGIYHYLVDTYQVEPNQSLFIDDLPQNVEGAKSVGFHTLQFQSSAQLHTDLQNLGIL